MDERERADNRPSVDQLAVWTKVTAGGDTMGTTAHTVTDIFADFGPKELGTKSVQCPVFAQVISVGQLNISSRKDAGTTISMSD